MSKGDIFKFADAFELRVKAIGKFSDVLMSGVNESQLMNRYGQTLEARALVL
jgi:hypothetical protein